MSGLIEPKGVIKNRGEPTVSRSNFRSEETEWGNGGGKHSTPAPNVECLGRGDLEAHFGGNRRHFCGGEAPTREL